MPTKIFVNLPVRDVSRSIGFFSKLGFRFDPDFTDDNAGSMVVGPDITVMLLSEGFFQTFTTKPAADALRTTETIVTLGVESRDQVDQIVDAALAAGARRSGEPTDQGYMYGRGFEDLDGHLWEIMYMDMSLLQR